MNRRIDRRITLGLVFGLVVLSCASPVLVPSPAPSTPLSSSVDRIIAQTAAAAQTQTAVLVPPTQTQTGTPTPTKATTITPTPTATVLFLIPTETGLPESLFAEDDWYDDSNDDGYEKPVLVREWDCRVISKSPPQGTVFTRGSTFQATWTVENTGTKTWPKKGVDIAYHSGADLREGKPYIDIPKAVGPGGKVTITLPLTAPNYPKVYSTRWTLRVGKTDFCGIKIIIEVK